MKQDISPQPVSLGDVVDEYIFEDNYPVAEKVTKVTINTLMNNRLGLAGSIAYIDNGATLYENFKRSHTPDRKPEESTSARLINVHKSALANEIRDIERLIIVGGGSYDSIATQELALVSELFAHEAEPKLKEIVLIDVSTDFINEGRRAIKDLQEKIQTKFKVIPLRADFKDISGDTFDQIMDAYGSSDRENTKAAVMMTGATFGNIESVSAIDKFPGNEVDEQMGHLAELVGQGSNVIFDHFTKIDTGVQYYDTRELSDFFNNIPVLMRKYCKGLHDFHVNGDNDGQQFFRYRARLLPNARMIAHELVAEQPQTPKVINGVERVFPINTGDTLNVMFSLQARADDITYRPVQNTGLASQMSVSHKDLQVMHVFKKVGTPGALYHPDTSFQTMDPKSINIATSAPKRSFPEIARIISEFRTPNVIGPGLAPA